MIAWLNHQLCAAEASHRSAAALGTARAERLDAVFNTAVDGIIVIDDEGQHRGRSTGAPNGCSATPRRRSSAATSAC